MEPNRLKRTNRIFIVTMIVTFFFTVLAPVFADTTGQYVMTWSSAELQGAIASLEAAGVKFSSEEAATGVASDFLNSLDSSVASQFALNVGSVHLTTIMDSKIKDYLIQKLPTYDSSHTSVSLSLTNSVNVTADGTLIMSGSNVTGWYIPVSHVLANNTGRINFTTNIGTSTGNPNFTVHLFKPNGLLSVMIQGVYISSKWNVSMSYDSVGQNLASSVYFGCPSCSVPFTYVGGSGVTNIDVGIESLSTSGQVNLYINGIKVFSQNTTAVLHFPYHDVTTASGRMDDDYLLSSQNSTYFTNMSYNNETLEETANLYHFSPTDYQIDPTQTYVKDPTFTLAGKTVTTTSTNVQDQSTQEAKDLSIIASDDTEQNLLIKQMIANQQKQIDMETQKEKNQQTPVVSSNIVQAFMHLTASIMAYLTRTIAYVTELPFTPAHELHNVGLDYFLNFKILDSSSPWWHEMGFTGQIDINLSVIEILRFLEDFALSFGVYQVISRLLNGGVDSLLIYKGDGS